MHIRHESGVIYTHFKYSQEPVIIVPDNGNDDNHKHDHGRKKNTIEIPYGELFKDLKISIFGGPENSLPKKMFDAVVKFQKEHAPNGLTKADFKAIAETGEFDGKPVPDDVRTAAILLSASDSMFDAFDSSGTGVADGKVDAKDMGVADASGLDDGTLRTVWIELNGFSKGCFLDAVVKGDITSDSPEDYDAAKTLDDFLNKNQIPGLTKKDLQEILADGKYKGKEVDDDVLDAIEHMLENDGELFKKLAGMFKGGPDDQLDQGDFDAGVKDGPFKQNGTGEGIYFVDDTIVIDDEKDTVNTRFEPLSRADAMDTLWSHYDELDADEDGRLTLDDLRQIANNPFAPENLRNAAIFVLNDEDLLRDIDGQLTGKDGKSDGYFTKEDLKNAVDNAHEEDFNYTGYGVGNEDFKNPLGLTPADAMNTLKKYEARLDANDDGKFSLDDIRQLANNRELPEDLRRAAEFVLNNEGLLRDIDGNITGKDGKSDGQFSKEEFDNAVKHANDPKYVYTGYGWNDGPKNNPLELTDKEAMNILSKHKNELDGNRDGKLTLDDFRTIANDPHADPDLKRAAAHVMKNEGLQKIIDGNITGKDGKSDGQFSMEDFENAVKHVNDGKQLDGYTDELKSPLIKQQRADAINTLLKYKDNLDANHDGKLTWDDLNLLANDFSIPEELRRAAAWVKDDSKLFRDIDGELTTEDGKREFRFTLEDLGNALKHVNDPNHVFTGY